MTPIDIGYFAEKFMIFERTPFGGRNERLSLQTTKRVSLQLNSSKDYKESISASSITL